MDELRYELELDTMLKLIEKEKPKRICIQLPDGLKPRVKEIKAFLKDKTDAQVLFWAGSCYGACDIPKEISQLRVDVLFQFGHSKALRMGQHLESEF